MSYTTEDFANIDHDIPWQNISLINSWVLYGSPYGAARYKRVNGIVYVYCMVQGGTSGTAIGVLPVGFRPSLHLLRCGNRGEPNSYGWNEIRSTGEVIAYKNDTWAALNMSFPAEQ